LNLIYSTGSPSFVTIDLTGITDGNIPYIQSAAAGFGDSPVSYDGTNVDITTLVDIQDTAAGGASNNTLIQKTYQAGETYSGTEAALTVKAYDADATVTHGSSEHAGLALFFKPLSSSATGGENMLMSLHQHSSGTETLTAGLMMYPKLAGSGIAMRAATMDYGFDLADAGNVVINTGDFRGHEGEIIFNDPDGTWDFGAANLTTTGTLTAGASTLSLIHLPEISTPTAVPDYGAVYPKTDNNLYFQDGAGVEHIVQLGTTDYGEMGNVYGSSATEALGDTNWHAMYHANITGAAPHLNLGFSFVAGKAGTIASASTDAGSTVTFTDNDHGLVAGDFITLNTMSDASYDGVYEVQSATTHTFTINETNTESTETGTWQMGSYLLVASAGVYRGAWNASFSQSVNNTQTSVITSYVNTTASTKATAARLLANNADVGSIGGNGLMSFSVGDRIWFAVSTTAAQTLTFTIRNVTIH